MRIGRTRPIAAFVLGLLSRPEAADALNLSVLRTLVDLATQLSGDDGRDLSEQPKQCTLPSSVWDERR
jgi:hypothetical protein